MKMFLISDNNDTFTGMRLVGVNGRVVQDRAGFKRALDKVLANKEIAILIITDRLSADYPELVKEAKLSKGLPLIVEIPDRFGSNRPEDFITHYVREAIGIKI